MESSSRQRCRIGQRHIVVFSPTTSLCPLGKSPFALSIFDTFPIRSHLTDQGILICGRFAEFKYLNLDAVAAREFAFLKEHRTRLAEAGRGTRKEAR